jgi:UDP-4-amino-4,6-dideoxy-N-acetyl-beta-L-altrosamine transaminase
MQIIPYGKQEITEEDIQAVVDVLKSDYLTQGPKILEFERAFASYIGSDYAVAVSNGTTGLHLAVIAMGIKEGDKVITTPISFAASANCVEHSAGDVVFSDIDSRTFLIDLDKLEILLKSVPSGTYKGVIPVHFAGLSVDMERLRKIADHYDIWIIEDACHAPGSCFTDSSGVKQITGNSYYSDMAVFSFHPVKHIATGEGGMITTNDREVYEKLLQLRTHGITRDPSKFKNSIEFAGGEGTSYPGWYMEMQELGYNYRITDIQAALGLSQLSRAEYNLSRRIKIALNYDTAFKDHPFLVSQGLELNKNNNFQHAYHLYIVLAKNRLGLYNYLKEKGIYCQIHYIPVHLMPYYREKGWKAGDMPESESYYGQCLSLPMYPSLSNEQQQFVIKEILKYYENE